MQADKEKVKRLFQQMTPREKLRYLWAEFHRHFFVVLGVIAILIVSIAEFVNEEDPVLWGMSINQSLASAEDTVNTWESNIPLKEGHCISFTDGVILNPNEIADPNSLSYGTAYQIICAAAVHELDFVFTDENGLIYLCNNELCTDVRDVLGEELLTVYGQYLYTPEELDYPIALDISGTSIAANLGLTADTVYLALPALSDDLDTLRDFLKQLAD